MWPLVHLCPLSLTSSSEQLALWRFYSQGLGKRVKAWVLLCSAVPGPSVYHCTPLPGHQQTSISVSADRCAVGCDCSLFG